MRIARWCFLVCAAAAACQSFGEKNEHAESDGGSRDAAAEEDDAAVSDDAAVDDAARAHDADADVSRPYRYAFVTPDTHDGNFGSLAGADAFCVNQALGTPLANLHWRAWLGTASVNPRDRIAGGSVIPYEYRLVTGEIVFLAGFTFVEGSLMPEHVIDRDVQGTAVSQTEVWTGADTSGKSSDIHCNGWSTNSVSVAGKTGFTTYYDGTHGDAGTSEWQSTQFSAPGSNLCDHVRRVYCFEVDE